MFCLYVCMCSTYVQRPKEGIAFWELELKRVLNHYMGAGN